jgi:pimeloyl-ACP methyl ester carboxylesterase
VNPTVSRVEKQSSIHLTNSGKSLGNSIGLTTIGTKPINYQKLGSEGDNVVFVHGLGGTQDYWTPLISTLGLDNSHSLHLFDLEGHGLSPTHALSNMTIRSLADDVRSVFDHAQLSASKPATLIAHSMGCLVALQFTLHNPTLVEKLILVGPPPSPLPSAASDATFVRAALVRSKGMNAVVDAVASAGTSELTKKKNPIAVTAVRLSLLSQDPESYAKACWALARATETLKVEAIRAKTLIVTGDEDKVSPPSLCERYAERISHSQLTVLKGTGHWHVYENIAGVAQAIGGFL